MNTLAGSGAKLPASIRQLRHEVREFSFQGTKG